MDKGAQERDCAVCLQKCHHPTQLPCGHIFCFLCVKGVAIQSKKCAMCRADIPPDYLDHPVLLEKNLQEQPNIEPANEEFQWYYEGRNGWWKYDERSNSELESAFIEGESECTLLLAGALYCINFQNMIQVRRSDPTRRRRVRRDTPMLPAKGIAGIKNTSNRSVEQTKNDSEAISNDMSLTSNQSGNEISGVVEISDDLNITETSNDDSLIQTNEVNDVIHALSIINLQNVEPSRDLSPSEDT